MAIRKAENIDPHQIYGTFKYACYYHVVKNDIIILTCLCVVFLGLLSLLFLYILFVAIMIVSVCFVLVSCFIIRMVIEMKECKEIEKWMEDAVELTVVPEYVEGDSIFLTVFPPKIERKLYMQSIIIQARFRLNGRMHCPISIR